MNLRLLHCGSCTFPDFLLRRGGGFRMRRFPALVAHLEHPRHGHLLFDTGYSTHFHRATRRVPEIFYALTTPVRFDAAESAASQLAELGIDPAGIRTIILSHLHADHVAGLRDFPAARFVLAGEALAPLLLRSRLSALRQGFLPALLPEGFVDRCDAVDTFVPHPRYSGILHHDLFGDGSLSLVPLPGHAPGHCGLLIDDDEHPVFLVADACWLLDELDPSFRRHPVASRILHDATAYDRTHDLLRQLRRDHPRLALIPCHDAAAHDLS
jgi:glyoxylase-like metal-dependent hydrolase (beta-lactamase superfamily II)